MDESFEAGLLAIVDDALTSPLTTETFRRLEQAYRDFYRDGPDKATAHVKYPWTTRNLFDAPAEYTAALDDFIPPKRHDAFIDIIEHMEWTVCDEWDLTEQDRVDGYRPLDEFWLFLRDWRDRYRREFGR